MEEKHSIDYWIYLNLPSQAGRYRLPDVKGSDTSWLGVKDKSWFEKTLKVELRKEMYCESYWPKYFHSVHLCTGFGFFNGM